MLPKILVPLATQEDDIVLSKILLSALIIGVPVIKSISYILGVFALIFLGGCADLVDSDITPVSTSSSQPQGLEDLVIAAEAGETCGQLFRIFDQIEQSSSTYETAQQKLRGIGCYTRTSARSDSATDDSHDSTVDNSNRERRPKPAIGIRWKGIPEGKWVSPTPTCLDAAAAAAGELDSNRAEPLIAKTLDACTSVNEWMSTLESHPGVMGMTAGYIPEKTDLSIVCSAYPNTAVCRDAAMLGIR